MKTRNSFSINFFLKKDKASRGTAPLYARITINRKFVDLSLKRKVKITAWDQETQKLAGSGSEERDIREKIRQTRNEINAAYDDLRFEKQVLTAEAVKAKAEGVDEEEVTLLWLINYHNTEVGKLLEAGTMKNYYGTERFIKEFIKNKKRRADIYLSQLDYKFVIDFEIYLRQRKPDKGQRPCGNNTVMKHIERLRKMVGIAMKNDWIVKDPFQRFERTMVTKDRESLEQSEFENIRSVELESDGHVIIRDMFLFSCYTGLAYADICRLNEGHIIKDQEGEHWIEMQRKKTMNFTGKKFFVLLLPEALSLIEKYKRHPSSLQKGTIFPYYSNQSTNRYLKIIAEKAKIKKDVTFHLARHTFATTITLENGVPMESVSKMLGHASIRTTQIYSKVRKKKVGSDMQVLREKMQASG